MPTHVGAPRLDQTRLRGRQQLREHRDVAAAGSREPEGYVAPRREPQLALAGEQHVPGFMLLPTDQGILAVGAECPLPRLQRLKGMRM
jgi:hypothetical protein